MRKTGISVVGDMPWGTHFCHFYETKEDLLDTLVPYFKAGLESNEFCVCVISEPLTEAEARRALGEAVPDFDRNVSDQRLETIVDDDESVRKAIRRLIKSAGLGVEDFASAEEFLGSGSSRDASCLILDVRLPGMSGLELQSRLAASSSHLPIIFTSAHDDGRARARALEAGAIDFLAKPFSDQDLFHAINASLTIRRDGDSDNPDKALSV